MKRGNFYRRDPDAALNGMSKMSLEERGVYNTVIDLMYLMWRPLEDNPKYIAAHCNCAVQKLNPILRRLIEMGKVLRFEEGGHFYLSNKRFDDERLAVKGPVKTRSGRGEVGEKSAGVSQNPPSCEENPEEKQVAILQSRVEQNRYYTEGAREVIDKPFLDGLEAKLREAAGPVLNVASPSLLSLAPILGLLRPGQGPACDLDADVLPSVRALAAKAKPGSVRTWTYFVAAITEARDLRLSGAGGSTLAPKVSPRNWTPDRWRGALEWFQESGKWGETYGPKPGEVGCWAPPSILAECGFAPREGGADVIPFRAEERAA